MGTARAGVSRLRVTASKLPRRGPAELPRGGGGGHLHRMTNSAQASLAGSGTAAVPGRRTAATARGWPPLAVGRAAAAAAAAPVAADAAEIAAVATTAAASAEASLATHWRGTVNSRRGTSLRSRAVAAASTTAAAAAVLRSRVG